MTDIQTPSTLCSDSDDEGYEESTLRFPILDFSKLPHRNFSLPPRILEKPLEFPKPDFDNLPSREFMLPRELRIRVGLAVAVDICENAEENVCEKKTRISKHGDFGKRMRHLRNGEMEFTLTGLFENLSGMAKIIKTPLRSGFGKRCAEIFN
ncbi:5675_t:CDS:1 [Paraglomus occultum]|uniref:5675_t:CDS:1 n=1 Tax=Paraglomus occultum TaxID=144539 RepID=A0A9N9AMZ6_9GLOM|nr:5675_t:CDS:1 [Paraglomus occultum]